MTDIIDGPISAMRDLNPNVDEIEDGRIWRSREQDASGAATEPMRESIFVWDATPYPTGAPLYEPPNTEAEVPRYVGFAPDIDGLRDGSSGLWRWVDAPRGSLDAERVYGISPRNSGGENATRFQRMVDEVLASEYPWPPPGGDPGRGDS